MNEIKGVGDDDSEVAATTKVEEADNGDKDNHLSCGEYLKNDGVHDCRLKIKSFPPKRPRHFLQPQLALLLPHEERTLSLCFYENWISEVLIYI